MTIRAIMASAAVAMFTVVHGQSSAITQPDKNASTPMVDQQPVHSIYHDCLVAAGNSTWTELGLNADQIERVTALQSNYKAELAAAEKSDGKSKKAKKDAPVKEKAVAVTPVPNGKDGKQEEAMAKESEQTPDVEKELVDPFVTPTEQDKTATAETVAPDAAIAPPIIQDAQGNELAGILTPEQWARWQKQCYTTTPVGMTGN